MVTVTCDKCGKAMDMPSFNASQTSVVFQYKVQAYSEGSSMPSDIDVCPHCAVATLTQLVQAWGG